MTDDALLDSAAVEIDQFYPHTPNRVWRALTDPACLAKWLMPTTGFEAPLVGAQFVFTVPTQPPGEIA